MKNSQCFQTSFANVGKPFPRISDLRFVCYETPTLAYSCVSPHLASVAQRWSSPKNQFSSPVSKYLHFECLPVVSLENTQLDFGLCLSSVARRWLKHRLVPHWHSPGCCYSSSLAEGSSSYSRGCATPISWVSVLPSPNSYVSALPSVILLRKYLLAQMAARGHRETHDIQQTKKMVPLITCEISQGEYVSMLVLGVNTLDLDLGVQINSIERSS